MTTMIATCSVERKNIDVSEKKQWCSFQGGCNNVVISSVHNISVKICHAKPCVKFIIKFSY